VQHGETEYHKLLILGRERGLPGSARLLLDGSRSGDIGDLDSGHFGGNQTGWFGVIYLENDRKKANQFYLDHFENPNKIPLRMVVLKGIILN
jgi:hypothetical protein